MPAPRTLLIGLAIVRERVLEPEFGRVIGSVQLGRLMQGLRAPDGCGR